MIIYKFILTFFVLSSLSEIQASTKISEPYRSINDLPFDAHGWFQNGYELIDCFKEKKIITVIEVGSWLGSSTRFIANLLPENGKIYAVDTWQGSPNESGHLQDPRLPYLYQLFLSNVKHAGLTEKIIPVRMNSIEASKALNVKADLIFIDASHDYINVKNDILAWLPHLNEGGIICGDDWRWESVKEAVLEVAKEKNFSVDGRGNYWRYY